MDLSHLKVLVSGAAGVGVGYGVCEALSQYGATVILNDIDQDKLDKASATHKIKHAYKADIANPAEVEKMFAQISSEIGVINGLVNNAGVGLSKPVQDITEEDFDKVYDVNVKAMWRLTKHFIKQLLSSNTSGNIVNVSSVHAHSSQSNYSAYASSKSAVEGFTRAIANEVGKHNIRCNAIAPGMVHAEQNLDLIRSWSDDPQQWVEDYINNQQVLHNYIEPIDCGNTAAFLLSDMSKAITGQTIYVDAGKTAMLFNKDYVS